MRRMRSSAPALRACLHCLLLRLARMRKVYLATSNDGNLLMGFEHASNRLGACGTVLRGLRHRDVTFDLWCVYAKCPGGGDTSGRDLVIAVQSRRVNTDCASLQ